jgi:hypothetical protein
MPIDDRVRRAAESILENESLGGDLMDDEAQKLLDWGLGLAERFARSTHAMDDVQAEPLLDEGLTALRRTMRRLGKLIGEMGMADPETAQNQLAKALEAADQLPGVQVRTPDDLQAELDALRKLPPGQALERVLSWFSLGGDA